ncbi:ABC transporter permease [Cryobacterium sp. CG_9.6]|uniref:ABC transporter permease n=1 Tax=Cryobacterium sp. CG_9.6 TaxID=2760710 RepID=UPI0024755BC2|nr:ABC transporter permease [Cryobacterium sp. CG_9.6]MDH6236139.1 peptide/nickel transport system permease protein [Cryobacterium sp. CG_9.6]
MASFITRRLIAAFFVLLAATFLMYILVALSGDPLQELREGNAPNKIQLMESLTARLNLDVPPVFRYFLWLGGVAGCFIGQCDLGVNVQGLPVLTLLQQAMGSTLQLVTGAQIIAIIVGLIVGITTALRQYSGYDYSVTFASFLFFSLPIFWVAVLLKQYTAIGFNDWLADPQIGIPLLIGISVVSGLLWMSLLGGAPRRRLITLAVATVSTGALLTYFELSNWFTTPSVGIVGVAVTAIATAVGITAISVGIKDSHALRGALVTAGLGIALYYPMTFYVFRGMSLPLFLGLAVGAIVVGGGIGYVLGGRDRWQSARTSAIVSLIVAAVIALDGFLLYWNAYFNSSRVNGRPMATIGSETPNLGGNFWIQGIDTFTHLLLPTIAIILISFASLTRYTRASMLEVMNQDYIRTARSKGLTQRTVVVRHALRNALIPISTVIALDLGALIGGAVITESVFGWSGMGQLFLNGLRAIDPNPVMAFFLITGLLAVVFNLIADLLYASLDPRIRVSS